MLKLCQNTSTVEILKCIPTQLRKFCNQPNLFVADKSEWIFVVVNCLTEDTYVVSRYGL